MLYVTINSKHAKHKSSNESLFLQVVAWTKKASVVVQSSPQELQVGPHSRSYLLVSFQGVWLIVQDVTMYSKTEMEKHTNMPTMLV